MAANTLTKPLNALGVADFTGTNWQFLPLKPGQIATEAGIGFLRDGYAASSVPFTPASGIPSTTVQAAIEYVFTTGGGDVSFTSVSSSATLSNRYTRFTGSTVSQTLTLPSGTSGLSRSIRNSASAAVTVARAGADAIDTAGVSSFILQPGEAIDLTFANTGAIWIIF